MQSYSSKIDPRSDLTRFLTDFLFSCGQPVCYRHAPFDRLTAAGSRITMLPTSRNS